MNDKTFMKELILISLVPDRDNLLVYLIFSPLPMLSIIGTAERSRLKMIRLNGLQLLHGRLVQFSFFNLFLVALLGVLLRAFPFIQNFPFTYKNVLHGHSHFAFGGWVMPILLALILKYFPAISQRVAYKHWRNIAVLLLFSAYGMLLSFPVQGYKAVSIFFSTLSVAASYYMAIVIWQALRGEKRTASIQFLKWGLIYLSLSTIGPFATGPMIALGYQGTPMYYNAIYYYLHFQYNGWFTFAVLAILYQMMKNRGSCGNENRVFFWLNAACIPTYFLSVLWSGQSLAFNLIGGVGAFLQLVAFFFLLKDVLAYSKKERFDRLFTLSIFVLCLKLVLQFVSAFPVVASMAYHYRNFVIAYLHLVLLGFISLFAFAAVFKAYSIKINGWVKVGMLTFFFSLVTTESLLVLHALGSQIGFAIPDYTKLLLACSILFPIGILILFTQLQVSIIRPKQLLQQYAIKLN